jgi:hypothetical protein
LGKIHREAAERRETPAQRLGLLDDLDDGMIVI